MSVDISKTAVEAERTAPVQRYPKRIPWSIHLKAYESYSKEYGTSQSAERLAERGGFGIGEMDLFYPKWREDVEEIPQLRAKVSALSARAEELETALKHAIKFIDMQIDAMGESADEYRNHPAVKRDLDTARSALTRQTAPRTDHGSQWPSGGDNRR